MATYAERTAEQKFARPQSLDEGEQRKLLLVENLDSINAQLGDRNRQDGDGQRVEAEGYFEWRRKAVAAKRHVEAELRLLNRWLKDERQRRHLAGVRAATADSGVSLGDPVSLLAGVVALARRMIGAGYPVTTEEQGLVDAAQVFLRAPMAAHPLDCECQTCLRADNAKRV